MTCHSRWMSAGFGLYVRTVIYSLDRDRVVGGGPLTRPDGTSSADAVGHTETARGSRDRSRLRGAPARGQNGPGFRHTGQVTGIGWRGISGGTSRRSTRLTDHPPDTRTVPAYGARRHAAGPHERGADVTDSTATATSDSSDGTGRLGESLTITRQPHRASPTTCRSLDGTIRAADIGKIKTDDDEPGPGGLRPRVREHRLVSQRGHLHRRRQGDPGVPRLPDRAAGREVQLPRGRLPADPRRAADQGAVRRLGARDHLPHVRARERPRASWRASATTPTRWACCWPRSARCRRSTPSRATSPTPTTGTCRSSG